MAASADAGSREQELEQELQHLQDRSREEVCRFLVCFVPVGSFFSHFPVSLLHLETFHSAEVLRGLYVGPHLACTFHNPPRVPCHAVTE